MSYHILCVFNWGQICQLFWPRNLLNILKIFFSSMGIIWVSAFLLKWHITFLLEEWQENELNNVLDAHGDVNIAINKPQKASESFNLEHLTPWCQGVCVCDG